MVVVSTAKKMMWTVALVILSAWYRLGTSGFGMTGCQHITCIVRTKKPWMPPMPPPITVPINPYGGYYHHRTRAPAPPTKAHCLCAPCAPCPAPTRCPAPAPCPVPAPSPVPPPSTVPDLPECIVEGNGTCLAACDVGAFTVPDITYSCEEFPGTVCCRLPVAG